MSNTERRRRRRNVTKIKILVRKSGRQKMEESKRMINKFRASMQTMGENLVYLYFVDDIKIYIEMHTEPVEVLREQDGIV